VRPLSIAWLAAAALLHAQDWGARAPEVVSRTEPAYSPEARHAAVNTTIKLSLMVNEHGMPEDVRVVRGAGFGLDEIAVHTVAAWRFDPASRQAQRARFPAPPYKRGTPLMKSGAGRPSCASSSEGHPVRALTSIDLNFRVADKGHIGQTARLNFSLPSGVARPILIAGKIPPNPDPAPGAIMRIRLTVSPDGHAGDFKTLETGNPEWTAQVLKEMSGWRFRPAAREGQAEEVNGIFELSISQPAAPRNWPELRRSMVSISPPEPQDTSLPAPVLIAPPDRAMFDSYPRRVTCKWESSSGAVSYLLEWDYLDQGAWHAEYQAQRARLPAPPYKSGTPQNKSGAGRPSCASSSEAQRARLPAPPYKRGTPQNQSGAGRPFCASSSEGIPGLAYVVNGTEYAFEFVGAQAGRWRVWPVNQPGQRGNPSEWRTFRYLQ
jgi:TonB family protein